MAVRVLDDADDDAGAPASSRSRRPRYILVAIQFEERDLVREHGGDYESYRRRVPMLIPGGAARIANVPESPRPPAGVRMRSH